MTKAKPHPYDIVEGCNCGYCTQHRFALTHGTYVERFFASPGKQREALEFCTPYDIAALFFEFLKNEGALKKVK